MSSIFCWYVIHHHWSNAMKIVLTDAIKTWLIYIFFLFFSFSQYLLKVSTYFPSNLYHLVAELFVLIPQDTGAVSCYVVQDCLLHILRGKKSLMLRKMNLCNHSCTLYLVFYLAGANIFSWDQHCKIRHAYLISDCVCLMNC